MNPARSAALLPISSSSSSLLKHSSLGNASLYCCILAVLIDYSISYCLSSCSAVRDSARGLLIEASVVLAVRPLPALPAGLIKRWLVGAFFGFSIIKRFLMASSFRLSAPVDVYSVVAYLLTFLVMRLKSGPSSASSHCIGPSISIAFSLLSGMPSRPPSSSNYLSINSSSSKS